MIRKCEVDDIDRVDTRLLQWHMIVGEGLAGSRREHLSVTELVGDLPYSLHHFRCLRHRKSFLKKLQVLVSDHIEQHRKQRGVSGRQVSGKIAGAEQRFGRVVEVAVVLAVHKEEIETLLGARY